MRTELFTVTGADGMTLPGILWLPEEKPAAVLQITHGMTEHIGRYTALAEMLTGQQIAVAGTDLRGHGKNPGNPECASFGEGGWEKALADMHQLYGFLAEKVPGVPHFHLGFSLGSFLLREYLNRYDDPAAGAVIMGTGDQPGAVLALIKGIVKGQIRKAGFDGTTPLVRKLSFDTYNQKFRPNHTPSDWLCADETELDLYRTDPLCRRDISAGLFYQLLDAMHRTGGKDAYENWNRQMPVLLLSGDRDPVGDFGKGVNRVYRAMEKAGCTQAVMRLFPGARHDLLHEEASGCGEQARKLLADWISENIK